MDRGSVHRVRFLFVVDDDAFIGHVAGALASDGFDVVFARDWAEGRLSIEGGGVGVVIAVESSSAPSHGAELRALRKQRPELVTVLLSARETSSSDGAHMVVSKEAGLSELLGVFHDAESVRRLTARGSAR